MDEPDGLDTIQSPRTCLLVVLHPDVLPSHQQVGYPCSVQSATNGVKQKIVVVNGYQEEGRHRSHKKHKPARNASWKYMTRALPALSLGRDEGARGGVHGK